MLLNTRRRPPLVDVCDFNSLHLNKSNADINTRNYLLNQSSSPSPYHDLRLSVTNRIPTNIVIISKKALPVSTLLLEQRKHENKKNRKQASVDVYRSLIRSVSHCSISSERDLSNDEINRLADSFTIDRVTLSPSTGYFYPHNLSKIQKHHLEHQHKRQLDARTRLKSSSFLTSSQSKYCENSKLEETKSLRRPPSMYPHDDDNEEMSTAETTMTKLLSCTAAPHTRRQIHVYVPRVYS